jgi:transmembrane sensor
LRRWVGYGAVILLIGIVGLQHFDVAFNPSTNTPARLNTYVTAPGQRAKIDLPDGSTVSLSVASRIRYAKNFGASSRDIHLEGEAYFEVSGNTTRPFTVHTGSTETRVLGTAFGVRKYEDEQSTRIIVNAGKVQVKAAATERVVTAGEAVQATAIDIATIPINASANAWMRGEMVFVKTPLTDVARELERWYGIKIHLNDPSLGEEVVTATLGSQTPQEAVRIITMMFNVRAVNNGSTITISRR